MRLILIGPPGVGKGTQSALLVARQGLIPLSSGDIFRTLNVFMRVETPWSEAEQHVNVVGHVPILMQGARASRFRGHTMQVTIETPEAGEHDS